MYYKSKRNTTARIAKWLRHEKYELVLNPFFKQHFIKQFAQACPSLAYLTYRDTVAIFRKYKDTRTWEFVVIFDCDTWAYPCTFFFCASHRTPYLSDTALRSAQPVSYCYLDGVKQQVRTLSSKRQLVSKTALTFKAWFKHRGWPVF